MDNATATKKDPTQAILERHVGKMVVDLRKQWGDELATVVRHLVNGGKLVYQGTSAQVLDLGPAPREKKKEMSREQLRCKHRDGKGCQRQSRGPRFHYRCEAHMLPPTQAKKTKKALKAKWAAKRETMRCKHGDGQECQQQSRGPRFHYRCEAHTLPPTVAKKTKKKILLPLAAKKKTKVKRTTKSAVVPPQVQAQPALPQLEGETGSATGAVGVTGTGV
jgi:hypothetical protein